MSFKFNPLSGTFDIASSSGGGGSVSSLNSLTGALSIVAGSGITVTPSGSNITVAVSGGSGANTALSNLSSVAINTSLLPGTTNSINLGSATLTYANLYVQAGHVSGSAPAQAGCAYTVDAGGGFQTNTPYIRVGAYNAPGFGQNTFLYDDGTNNELSLAQGPTHISPNGNGGLTISKSDFGSGATWQVLSNSNVNQLGNLLFPNNSNIGTSITSQAPNIINGAQAIQAPSLGVPGYQRVSATSAGSTTINNNTTLLVLNASGTLTTYTVTMPASPYDGQIVAITCNQAQTATTFSANSGQTITGGSAVSIPLGSSAIRYVYVLTDTNWYPM
jgi:hypothetical protein